MSFSTKMQAYQTKIENRRTWQTVGDFAFAAGATILNGVLQNPSIFTGLFDSNNETDDTTANSENTTNTSNKTENETQEKVLTEQEKIEEINKMLTGTGVALKDEYKDDVLKKYDALNEYYNVASRLNGEDKETAIKRRITNYIKGLEYRKLEDSWAQAVRNKTSETAEDKKMPTTKAAYKELGAQYIEVADKNNDEYLDLEEYTTLEQRSDNITALSQEQKSIINNTFEKLDINNDQKLDSTEFATHFSIMSVINDKGNNGTFNDITANEWSTTQQALFDISLEDMNLSNDTVSKLETLLENSTGKPTKEDLIKAGISEKDAEKIEVYIASLHYNELSDKYYNLFNS